MYKFTITSQEIYVTHDDVTKWKLFPRYWPFVRGFHRWPVNSPHKGQWGGALMFSLIGAWINRWINSREAGDLRRHRHCDVTLMLSGPGDKCIHLWTGSSSVNHYELVGLWKKLRCNSKQNMKIFFQWKAPKHYSDVTMGTIASKITSVPIIYLTVPTGAEQRKHQSSASLAFVREFIGDQWIPRTNGQ